MYVMASIWRTSYIRKDILHRRVICITFGLPVVSIPYIKEVAEMFPKFESTIHSIFSTEDVIPQLLKPLTSTSSPFLSASVKTERSSPTSVKTGMTSPRPARRSSISRTDREQVVKSEKVGLHAEPARKHLCQLCNYTSKISLHSIPNCVTIPLKCLSTLFHLECPWKNCN